MRINGVDTPEPVLELARTSERDEVEAWMGTIVTDVADMQWALPEGEVFDLGIEAIDATDTYKDYESALRREGWRVLRVPPYPAMYDITLHFLVKRAEGTSDKRGAILEVYVPGEIETMPAHDLYEHYLDAEINVWQNSVTGTDQKVQQRQIKNAWADLAEQQRTMGVEREIINHVALKGGWFADALRDFGEGIFEFGTLTVWARHQTGDFTDIEEAILACWHTMYYVWGEIDTCPPPLTIVEDIDDADIQALGIKTGLKD